jgi:hypothetical protein
MEAAPAPEPQGVNIPAIVAGAAIGKAIAVKGNCITLQRNFDLCIPRK